MRGTAFTFGDEINTDYIAPEGFDESNLVTNLMAPNRPGFHEEISKGDLIVAGEHFGSGSSRETAPLAIQRAGIAAVIAESFSRLFYRNSVNIGLPVFIADDVTDRVSEGDTIEVVLPEQRLYNHTTGEKIAYEPIPPEFREIFDAGGLLEYYAENGPSRS